ncbi:hypothetical protein PV10_08525 [Exophiala mesophila]|uniref:Elongator complex protein 1 n=1 Tax=Exophiala mesophila TaxID=212818 RepID=A0A0D1Z4P8_EXOME|nr:uncharacterized protein PV10_08525 [Exophiala mesophila]KIV88894.1 hypothetical protein PV10_08525 [Exophiala mesophila]
MRNLKIVGYQEAWLQLQSSSPQLPLTATAWDAGNDTVICAFGPTTTAPFIELKRRQTGQATQDQAFELIASWDAPSPLEDLACDEILLLQHFPDTATSCLVLAGGDVIVVRENPQPDQEKIEIVGSVDVGICAAAWAPDEELLAIVTRADTLALMSRNFEPLNEATLSADDLKASKHVSVGWGKKETQFQGARAKALRDPTVPERVDEGLPSPNENGKIVISWRGDGQYFAINSFISGHRRVIRVFTRDAVLDSASEPVDGFESALSWKPSGSLIAGIKRNESSIEVVFFERNGLRHGQFDLRVDQNAMNTWASSITLDWNTDSSVLAVGFLDRVQFWVMGNYHYYLKQVIPLVGSNSSAIPLRWHPETPLRALLASNSCVLDVTFQLGVSRGTTLEPYDHGIVAVIDGKSLKLTPFKQAGVPPPMAFCEVNVEHNIVDVALGQDGQQFAILTTHTLELCRWTVRSDPKVKGNTNKIKFTTNVNKQSIAFPEDDIPVRRYTQIVLKDGEAYMLSPRQAFLPAFVRKVSWIGDDVEAASDPLIEIDGEASTLLLDSAFKDVFYTASHLTKPLLHSSESVTLAGSQPNSSIFTLPSSDTAHLSNGYTNSDVQEYHKVSLSSSGYLTFDNNVIVRDCTSYILTSQHLVFTTAQHFLKFAHLTDSPDLHIPGDTPEVDERCRSIERGAKIVTVIPSTYAVILQMPRGNLETIYPRILVLTGIRRHVQAGEYLAAFLACQTHQVDLNILHDLDPEKFLASIPDFISQLKKPSRIDEFLSKLKDEDVTKTLYVDTTSNNNNNDVSVAVRPPYNPKSTSDKVNRIASGFLAAFDANPSTHAQNIITTHVCKRPADLDSALRLVSSLRQSSTGSDEAETAVSHLCFLSDTNRLYDAALALYDLELTLLVAQNAQRDPREYMPFLESLSELPELRRKYTIDNHLKRHSKALVSLHAMQVHDEVSNYTVKHSLYTTALTLYKYDQPHLTSITRLYADHLAAQSQHTSAATLYESLDDYTSAYPLYALGHKWRESLTCAQLAQIPKDKLTTLAHSLATTCTDITRDYRSAAAIHVDYLSDIPGAAQLLCKGSYFAESLRLLTLHHELQSIPVIIDTSLTEKSGEILELVADCRTQLASQLPRIAELRRKKLEDPLAFYGGDAALAAADGHDIPDNISLAPTDTSTHGGQSLFTRYGGSDNSRFAGTVASNVSRKTSKTKRREERKRARGKKGSVYEEEYLVASVGRLIERVNGVHDEVARLVAGLLRRGMREQAEQVQKVVREIVVLCGQAREEVWGVVDAQNQVDQQGLMADSSSSGARPPGADGVLWDSQQEAQGRKQAPEVKEWVENDLLAGNSG